MHIQAMYNLSPALHFQVMPLLFANTRTTLQKWMKCRREPGTVTDIHTHANFTGR